MNNDWYEFAEYGTINKLTIFLQRNGFSRETAMYIRQHRSDYVVGLDDREPEHERISFLETALERYNDGQSKKLYCIAAAYAFG
jgi:hypothetical protein